MISDLYSKMHDDLDNLIRSAKPATNDLARQRVIAQVVPAFVPVVPTPWLRIAAALVLAAASGFAAVAWLRVPEPPPADPIAQLEQDVANARKRVDALNSRVDGMTVKDRPEARLQPFDQAVSTVVRQTLEARDQQRREQHRERHLAYARKHYQQEVDRAVVSLKADYRLSEEQEKQIRKVFDEHGTQVEGLIGKHYRGGFHGKGRGRGMDSEFEKIIEATQGRLSVVLAEVPRNLPGADLAEWGPNPEFATTTDYETWLNWSEEVRQSG